MKFSLRQMAVFAAVARQESVSRAAEALSLSQSATSTALAELEVLTTKPIRLQTEALYALDQYDVVLI